MTSWGTLGPEPAGRPDLLWLPLLKLSTLSENMCASSLSPRLLAGPPPARPEPGRPLPQAGPLRPRLLSPRRGCQEFESQRLRVHFWSHCPQRHLTESRVGSRSLLAC